MEKENRSSTSENIATAFEMEESANAMFTLVKAKATAFPAAGGAGAGTLLYLLASNFAPHSFWRNLFQILAPSIAAFFPLFWEKSQKQVFKHMLDKETEKLFKRAKVIVKEGINNPLVSSEHREKLKREYEELEITQLQACTGRLKQCLLRQK